jgi:hypothetical protein
MFIFSYFILMKRLITFVLILLVLIVVGLITLNLLDRKKNNIIEPFYEIPTSSASLVINDLDGFDGIIKSVNVRNVRDKFYSIPIMSRTSQEDSNCDNLHSCTDSSSCDTNQECIDLDDGKKCYNVLDKQAYELEEQQNSYIMIQNKKENNLFSFSFGFILKNVDLDESSEKCILSSETNLWSIKCRANNLYLEIHGPNSNNDLIKLSNNPIVCYKYYNIIINVSDIVVKVNFNSQPNTSEIFLKPKQCVTSVQCEPGTCAGESGSRYCVASEDIYYIGKKDNYYYDMFVGDIKINNDEIVESQSCNFYGKNFKNKRVCLETCKNMNCDTTKCTEECKDVKKCSFEASGRHSIDCLQRCIRNDDCDNEHCVEQCNNCVPNCPWIRPELDTDDFDSQYFDPDGKPSPLKLILNNVSPDGTKVSVSWREPYNGKLSIKGYISNLFKTFNKSEGVKVNKISASDEYCISEDDNRKKCQYIIHDLIPNETYTLGIKSYNGLGLSVMSNLITFKASVTNINMDLRIESEVSDYDVGDFNYCNIDN